MSSQALLCEVALALFPMRIFADTQAVLSILRAMNDKLRTVPPATLMLPHPAGRLRRPANHKADITPETHGPYYLHDSLVKGDWEHLSANEGTGRCRAVTLSKRDLCVSSFNILHESNCYHSTKLAMGVTLSRGRNLIGILWTYYHPWRP